MGLVLQPRSPHEQLSAGTEANFAIKSPSAEPLTSCCSGCSAGIFYIAIAFPDQSTSAKIIPSLGTFRDPKGLVMITTTVQCSADQQQSAMETSIIRF